jgi:hypothetical protein
MDGMESIVMERGGGEKRSVKLNLWPPRTSPGSGEADRQLVTGSAWLGG